MYAANLCQLLESQLFVITIPPSLHVHETTKRLETPSRTYNEYTVFMRQSDSVQIAAAADRDAMRERKQRHFNESNKVSPVLFASGLGMLAGGVVDPDEGAPPTVAQRIRNGAIGGVLGLWFGVVYRQGVKTWREVEAFEQIPHAWRGPLFIAYMGAAVVASTRIVRGRRRQP
jgi:hypothetical protein